MRTNLSPIIAENADDRCAYVYKGNEFTCESGRHYPGERCSYPRKNGLFCGHHDPGKDMQKREDDRRAAREQIQAYVIDKEFDFREMMEEMKGMDPLPGEENSLEKYLLVLWAVAPEASRRPKTIDELSRMLERSVSQLHAWLRGSALKRVTEIERARFYMMNALAIDALVMDKARRGERWAIQVVLSQSPGGKAGELMDKKIGGTEKNGGKGGKGMPQKLSMEGPTREIVQRLSKSTKIPGVRYEIKRKSAVLREDDDGRDTNTD